MTKSRDIEYSIAVFYSAHNENGDIMKFKSDTKSSSKYWRGFVTGAMIGSGLALLLAQRKNSENWDDIDDNAIEATEIFAADKSDDTSNNNTSDGASDDKSSETSPDALDETLTDAKKVAQEIKDEARDAWNETLDNVKKPAP